MSHQRPSIAVRRIVTTLLLACVCALGTGCVHRRMTIESNPVGALVVIDGKEVGYTPVSVDFTYYGTRDVTLIRDGFETKTVAATLRAPWYQVFPLDFVSDNFLPYQVTNRHRFNVDMQPVSASAGNLDDLRDRGNSFRSQAFIAQ